VFLKKRSNYFYIEMNSIMDNIKQRRSIRSYKNKKIPKKLIEDIIEAGRFAPSAHNSQQCRFIIINNKKTIKKCSEHIKRWFKVRLPLKPIISLFNKKLLKTIEGAEKRVFNDKDLFFYDAPLLILICAKDNSWAPKDASCAAQNMMLAARSLNIGSCWIGYADHVLNKSRPLLDELGVPKDLMIHSTLVFGYPESFPKGVVPRKKDNVIKWI